MSSEETSDDQGCGSSERSEEGEEEEAETKQRKRQRTNPSKVSFSYISALLFFYSPCFPFSNQSLPKLAFSLSKLALKEKALRLISERATQSESNRGAHSPPIHFFQPKPFSNGESRPSKVNFQSRKLRY